MKTHIRYVLLVAVALAVMGVGVAVAVFMNLQDDSAKQRTEDVTSDAQQVDPAVIKADEASKIAYGGDLQAGIDLLDSSINSSNDSHEKSVFYSQKGILLFNNKKFDDALTAAKQSFELEQTVDGAAFIGQIARAKGDKVLALEYYKKALALVDVDGNPMGQIDKDYYGGVIAEIESGS